VAQQLQRYFGTAVGLGIAIVWLAMGASAGLACLAVAGLSYGATALTQRGSLGRIATAAARERRRARLAAGTSTRARRPGPRSEMPARPRPVPVVVPDVHEPGVAQSVVAEPVNEISSYGW
jgi:hypothetical protein